MIWHLLCEIHIIYYVGHSQNVQRIIFQYDYMLCISFKYYEL